MHLAKAHKRPQTDTHYSDPDSSSDHTTEAHS